MSNLSLEQMTARSFPAPVRQSGAWECPRCHVINAWWKSTCSCKPPSKAER